MLPINYSWLDADAPVLDDQPGSLINLLDKCLVTGYGTHAAAGWSKPLTGSGAAVFRAPAGLRHMLRVHDAAGQTVNVEGFKSMADIAVDQGAYPFVAVGGAGGYVGKSNGPTNGDATREWYLHATDRAFWLFSTRTDQHANFWPFGFGELAAHHPNDENASFLVCANTAESALTTDGRKTEEGAIPIYSNRLLPFMPGSLSVTGPGARCISFMPGAEHTGSPAVYGVNGNGYSNDNTSTSSANDGQNQQYHVYTQLPTTPELADWVWASRILVHNSSSVRVAQTNYGNVSAVGASATPRGYLPGLLWPFNILARAQYPKLTDMGNGRLLMPQTNSYATLIATGEDWDVTP